MSATTLNAAPAILTPEDLLAHWQGHRKLTRRVIEAFPEKELFEFTIGGMRTFALLVAEMATIATGIDGLAYGKWNNFEEKHKEVEALKTKAELLAYWDELTDQLNAAWPALTPERLRTVDNSWGFYEGPVVFILQYFVDNEIHHRGQGYVYLRALGIEPPAFYER
ncbi:DinB family protein [Chitinophaga sp. Cy-1792]|uniref:DinB family protein n=1 Tax=Chitinophaga sp. Cy-1792 TaxID=2608339 RepID=UPI001421BE19|nr:DinB family protein [Chitinophaga sp. Cy-1792]NIG56448.1 damage-inducible protein DinB [Chitinophaga sp. Cy-1792]